ncbi:di-trans,poly-cis-decaprenylcistransferase [Candidatus Woesearchaeota archaeon]|nr:di-trans,poly-cis-decaprenylcistransferase [Candidatus Woesearchaeota archaeon]
MKADTKIPRHIAIIPDGNRRWAKKKGLPAWEGHRQGAKVFEKTLTWCKELGVKELSFWGASTENLERDKAEVEFLFKLFSDMCDRIIKQQKDKKAKDKACVMIIGDREKIPGWLKEKFEQVTGLTKNNKDYKLNLLIGYGGRWDITEAAKKIAKQVKENKLKIEDITPEAFQKNLALEDEPDLIIRTSEERLSGLLPWQSIYSEIIFLKDKHWPEFTKEDLKKCIEEYSTRQRRFGH